MLFAVAEGYSKNFDVSEIEEFERGLYAYFENNCPDLANELKSGRKMSNEVMEKVRASLTEYAKRS